MIFLSNNIYAQPKTKPKSIINTNSSIKKYYDRKDLESLQKGELIELYMERMKVLINIMPNIGLASKPGITMSDLGIPDSSDNRKALDEQFQVTTEYLTPVIEFQKKMLPYSDKLTLINCILFYESTLKQINVLGESE